MIFKEDFFDDLPSDLTQACKKICEAFIEFDANVPDGSELDYYENYLDAYAAFEVFINTYKIELETPALVDNKAQNIRIISDMFFIANDRVDEILNANVLEAARFKYKAKFNGVFSYNFSDGDIKQIQKLINELRDSISTNTILSIDHKRRLIFKLEALQKELHKKMSDLARFWDLFGEAGVMLGKFGNDVKPLVDRIREILGIAWRSQASANELPSGTDIPHLTHYGDTGKGPDNLT